MKTNYLPIMMLLGLLALGSCKKDDDSGGSGGGVSVIIPEMPPAGFTFPHTYAEISSKTEFAAWFHDIDRTAHHVPNDFFPDIDSEIRTGFKFLSKEKAELTDKFTPGTTVECGYYFYRDTLWLHMNGDTIPGGLGNYNSFRSSNTAFLVSHNGGRVWVNGWPLPVTKAMLIEEWGNGKPVDSLVYFNYIVTLK